MWWRRSVMTIGSAATAAAPVANRKVRKVRHSMAMVPPGISSSPADGPSSRDGVEKWTKTPGGEEGRRAQSAGIDDAGILRVIHESREVGHVKILGPDRAHGHRGCHKQASSTPREWAPAGLRAQGPLEGG